MYFQDLSDEQQKKIWEMLRNDPEITPPGVTEREQNESIDDWINRNNTSETILQLLVDAYKTRLEVKPRR